METNYHVPVLLNEVIENLKIIPGKRYIDATSGGGGHGLAILEHKGILLSLDVDPEALEATRGRLSSACPNPDHNSGFDAPWRLAQGNFSRIEEIARKENFVPVMGILFDLGVSSHQLETDYRGFSFNLDGPLDMRMGFESKVKAADLVNGLNKGELADLFFKLGGEHFSRQIAEAIIKYRQIRQIKTCNELTEIILKVRPRRGKYDRTHPATRCFQALRIAVNDELNNLKSALPQAVNILDQSGRIVIITFHSGEDKIVKNFFKEMSAENKLKIFTKKPLQPTLNEVKNNPKSRSAKLRVGEKI